jgi:hypothetical protein
MNERTTSARLLAQYRDAVEPSEQELAAVWRDVSDPDAAPRILAPRRARSAPPAAPRRGLRLAVGGGLVALAAAVAIAWWIGSTSRRAAAVAEDDGSQAPYGVEAHERGGRAVRGEPDRAASVAPTSAGSQSVEGADASMPAAASGPAREPSSSAAASRSRSRSTKPDTLAREAELLRRAEALLRSDDHAGALDVLAEHAREYPQSSLAVERAALRAIALCLRGNEAQGRGEAVLLERHAASRPYRERIRRACASD